MYLPAGQLQAEVAASELLPSVGRRWRSLPGGLPGQQFYQLYHKVIAIPSCLLRIKLLEPDLASFMLPWCGEGVRLLWYIYFLKTVTYCFFLPKNNIPVCWYYLWLLVSRPQVNNHTPIYSEQSQPPAQFMVCGQDCLGEHRDHSHSQRSPEPQGLCCPLEAVRQRQLFSEPPLWRVGRCPPYSPFWISNKCHLSKADEVKTLRTSKSNHGT